MRDVDKYFDEMVRAIESERGELISYKLRTELLRLFEDATEDEFERGRDLGWDQWYEYGLEVGFDQGSEADEGWE